MRDLPRGWEWVRFDEVARVDSNLVDPADHLDLPHIAPNHIQARTGRLLPYRSVREDGVTSGKHLFTPGHILYSKIRPYLAKAVRVDFAGLCSADMYPVSTGLSPRYLLQWLLSTEFTALAAGEQGRSVLPKINKEGLAKLPVPVPPIAEQERIVAAIEEHLSRLDAAGGSLSSARRRLEALGQRLRDEAVAGEPTRLGALLAEPLRNGLSAPASTSGTIRVVTLTAVTKSKFSDAHSKLIEPGARPVGDLWMRPGDVFIQRSNTPELVGTAALYNGPDHWAIFPDLLIRVRVDQTRIYPSYLELVLRSTGLRRYFQRSAQGIAGSMPKISQPIIEAAEVPLPPLDLQRSLVRRLSDDLTITGRMAAEVERSDVRMRGLRRTILAAAFSGQLVPQNPADVPASALLERIRAERAAATPSKRARKAKAS